MAGDAHAMVGCFLCVALVALVLIPFAGALDRPVHPAAVRIPPADRRAPTTLGWRSWIWDAEQRVLVSPTRRTAWLDPELRCDDWDTSDAVRGAMGIHAHLVPVHWEAAQSEYAAAMWAPPALAAVAASQAGVANGTRQPVTACLASPPIVTGIVERFGRYVLGTDGWRAEWVIVRKLRAPTPEIAEALARAYPDVEIVHEHWQVY